jgi:AcrR family transcriptional regulator
LARREDQEDRIRREAALLWAKRGYHATGIAELCSATGLGKGGLYHYIGSKENLLYEISIRSVTRLSEGAEGIVARDIPIRHKLRLMSRLLMRNIADDRPEWTVFFREVYTLRGKQRAQVLARRERYEQLWSHLIEEGHRTGELNATNPLVVKGILGMHNYSWLWLRPAGPMKPEEIADAFCDVLLGGLLSDGHRSELYGQHAAGERTDASKVK